MWLLGKTGLHNETVSSQHTTLLLGTGITAVLSAVIAGGLFASKSSTGRGIALGTVASALAVAMGAVAYALWIF
jgi:hypothetical protein